MATNKIIDQDTATRPSSNTKSSINRAQQQDKEEVEVLTIGNLKTLANDALENLPTNDEVVRSTPANIDLNVVIYDGFDCLPAEYDQFFNQMAQQSFFHSRPWFENLARTTLENGARLRLYAVEAIREKRSPQALLVTTNPAAQNGARIRGWWVGKSSIAGFTNYQSYTHTLLLPDSTANTAEVTRALVSKIQQEQHSLIDLNLFTPTSPNLSLLIWAFKDAGMPVSTYDYAGNWIEDTSHLDFQQYLKNRSKSIRKGTLRKKRRLQEAHDIHFEIITETQKVEKAITQFDAVYTKSWKEQDYFKDFTPGLIRTCAEQGTLRLGILYVDGKAASVEMCIVANKQATFAKSAYDPKYADYSISSILLLHVIEHVITTDQVQQISFGVFDDPYKKSWCNQRRELWGVVAFNTKTIWGKVGFVCFSINRIISNAKQQLKPLLLEPAKNSRS